MSTWLDYLFQECLSRDPRLVKTLIVCFRDFLKTDVSELQMLEQFLRAIDHVNGKLLIHQIPVYLSLRFT